MSEQGVNGRFTATEFDKQVHRILTAALFKNIGQKSFTGFLVKNAFFFKQGKSVTGQDFRPFVAVITRRITAGKNMRKTMGKAVEFGRLNNGNLGSDLLQNFIDAAAFFRIVILVNSKIKQAEFQLSVP